MCLLAFSIYGHMWATCMGNLCFCVDYKEMCGKGDGVPEEHMLLLQNKLSCRGCPVEFASSEATFIHHKFWGQCNHTNVPFPPLSLSKQQREKSHSAVPATISWGTVAARIPQWGHAWAQELLSQISNMKHTNGTRPGLLLLVMVYIHMTWWYGCWVNTVRVVHGATCQEGRCRGMWVAVQSELPSRDMGTSGPINYFICCFCWSENQDEMCAQATGRHLFWNQWRRNNIQLEFKTATVQNPCLGFFLFWFWFHKCRVCRCLVHRKSSRYPTPWKDDKKSFSVHSHHHTAQSHFSHLVHIPPRMPPSTSNREVCCSSSILIHWILI